MDKGPNYISLQDATKFCDYTQEYLSLRARQGKLKAVKFGRNWVTKEEWLKEYLGSIKDYNNNFSSGFKVNYLGITAPREASFVRLGQVPDNLPIEPDTETIVKIKLNESPRFSFSVFQPIFSLGLVFILLAANIAFGKEDLSQAFKAADHYVAKIGESFDLGVKETFNSGKIITQEASDFAANIFNDSVQSVVNTGKDISSFTYALGNKGDELVRGSKKSVMSVGSDISTAVNNINFGIAQISSGAGENLNSYFFRLKQNYFAVNNFIGEKITDAGKGVRNLASNIGSQVSRAGKFVLSPWNLLPSKVVEVNNKDLEKIQKDIEALKANEGIVKEVEVSKIIRVEPIREITKEILKIDDRALAQVRAQLMDMESAIGNRLYAPGGVITQQIYIKEPVSSPKVYQENGDIVLQTVGSGNVILSAATGMQISGSQVVIDSTSINNPLIYIADRTRIGGNTEIGGTLAVSSGITAQTITLNALAGFTGKVLDVQVGGSTKFSVDQSGGIFFDGTGVTSSSTLTVYGTTTLATLQGSVGVGTTTPATTLGVYGTSTFMGGSVGIGTTTPGYTLSVVGNIYGSGNAIFGGTLSSATTTITGDFLPATTTTYNIGSSAYKWANIYAATGTFGGTIVINTDSIVATSSLNLTGAAASLWQTTGAASALTIQSASTLTASSTGDMIFATAGSERMRIASSSGNISIGTSTFAGLFYVATATPAFIITSAGQVGIGITSPAYTLDINGQLRIVSTTTFNGNIVMTGATSTIQIPFNATSSLKISDATNTYMTIHTTAGGEKIVMGADVEFGTMQIAQDSGAVTFADFPVTSSSATNTEESYAFQIDSNTIFKIYSQSDGSGGAKNRSVLITNISGGAGTPSGLLELQADSTNTTLTITTATSTLYDPQIVFRTGTSTITRFVLGVDQSDSNRFKIATSTLGTGDILTIDNGTGNVAIGSSTAATLFSVATSTNIFNVLSSGFVGIGTTTPGYTLSVVGNIYGSGNAIFGGTLSSATTTITGDLLPNANLTYNLGSATAKWKNIFVGTTTIGGTIVINTDTISATSTLTVTAASSTLISSANTLTASSTGDMIFTTAGSERMRIDDTTGGVSIGTTTALGLFYVATATPAFVVTSGGNVGIGTTSPATTLTVYGTSTFMGGSVGIGTAIPLTNLDINPTGNADIRVGSWSDMSGNGDGTALFSTNFYAQSSATYKYSNTHASIGYAGINLNSGVIKFFNAIGTTTRDASFTPTETMRITNTGNIGIGTTSPAALLDVYASSTATALTVAQTMTGNIVDFKSSAISVFALKSADQLNLRDGLVQSWGDFNNVVLDDFEDNDVTNWTTLDTTNTKVAATTTQVKVNDYSFAITTAVDGSNGDTATTVPATTTWSGYERLGFWLWAQYNSTSSVEASTTKTILNFRFKDSGGTTTDSTSTIREFGKWQYEEVDLTKAVSTDRDVVSWYGFRIENDYGSPTFFIDQIRLYNTGERAAEMFVDSAGGLNLVSPTRIDLTRGSPGTGSRPGLSVDTAVVEINQPLVVNTGGDVGLDYDLVFNNTGLSSITSEGPLTISAGDANHYENLTLKTGGTGDIIMDIASSTLGFKIMGSATSSFGSYILRVDPTGTMEVGGRLTVSGSIYPATTSATSSVWELGTTTAKWKSISAITSNIGDIIFANQFVLTEALTLGINPPEAMIFQNSSSTIIMSIDENGVLTTDTVKTRQLCVGNVCVTEAEFQAMFSASIGGGGSPPAPPAPPPATSTPPETTIDSASPPNGSTATSTEAIFSFFADVNDSTFQCRASSTAVVNESAWEACVSPKTYSELIPGDYTFQVYATNPADGSYDESPASSTWSIIE